MKTVSKIDRVGRWFIVALILVGLASTGCLSFMAFQDGQIVKGIALIPAGLVAAALLLGCLLTCSS